MVSEVSKAIQFDVPKSIFSRNSYIQWGCEKNAAKISFLKKWNIGIGV